MGLSSFHLIHDFTSEFLAFCDKDYLIVFSHLDQELELQIIALPQNLVKVSSLSDKSQNLNSSSIFAHSSGVAGDNFLYYQLNLLVILDFFLAEDLLCWNRGCHTSFQNIHMPIRLYDHFKNPFFGGSSLIDKQQNYGSRLCFFLHTLERDSFKFWLLITDQFINNLL